MNNITEITIVFIFAVISYSLTEHPALPFYVFTKDIINEYNPQNPSESQIIFRYAIITSDFKINRLIKGGEQK